ncbi:hypothetical protein QVD17_20359 [Tagetes erecta]|uniref:RNA helicase n=1 Tax=Tagetes erecta TaxID=13708 RepID=A0AAD8KLD0_TARER|nr:hypothetical protein QVD17_20359 [Tagetes erecta]
MDENWSTGYCWTELRRLDDYSFHIQAYHNSFVPLLKLHQVLLSVGETGLGKCKQMVRIIAHSVVAGDKSIVCVQPNELAAASLDYTVKNNSNGCKVIFSSSELASNSKVISMTSQCLLQHYMNDKNFSWASYFIIDKAHERSMCTVLLLALLKDLSCRRADLYFLIISTHDGVKQLVEYWCGSGTYQVVGQSSGNKRSGRTEPKILRDNFGTAILRVLALGTRKVEEFDFLDVPFNAAIETAIKNLIELGVIALKDGIYKLTKDGQLLVKLGIEHRLVKLLLNCSEEGLGKEGLVLVAGLANSSISMFYRGVNEEEKQNSDCLKLRFCHTGGDIFTFLSVYKEWEDVPWNARKQWGWDNSINIESMMIYEKAVHEMERCFQEELHITIPNKWHWDPVSVTEYDKILKDVMLSALKDNIAIYSGSDNLGYEVASTGKHVQLHPSCSLLIFGERPNWVVFWERIENPNQYLVCVTSVDFDSLWTLSPAPFDISQMEGRKLQSKVLTGLGTTLLRRLCGRSNSSLKHLVSTIKATVNDDPIQVEVSVDHREVYIFTSSQQMSKVTEIVNLALEREGRWIRNECIQRCVFPGGVALLGSGAEIKHLELKTRCLAVDISVLSPHKTIVEKDFLSFLEKQTSGDICMVDKLNPVSQDDKRWSRVTFLTPEAAEKAIKLNTIDFNGCTLEIAPSGSIENKILSFPAVRAKVYWPRWRSNWYHMSVWGPVGDPSPTDLENTLLREVISFMPPGSAKNEFVSVHVFPCQESDDMIAEITFDASLHLEAAQALEHIDGKILRGLTPLQTTKCVQLFTSTLYCSAPVYMVIKDQVRASSWAEGTKLEVVVNENKTCHVNIFAKATIIVAELGRRLEQLMNGRTIINDEITPPVLQLLYSPEGFDLQKSIEKETGTYILFDRLTHCLKVFGPLNMLDLAQRMLVRDLVQLHEYKQLDVYLRGPTFPPCFMKMMVQEFGPRLHLLKEKFPGAEFKLNTLRHTISVGGNKEDIKKVKNTILEILQTTPFTSSQHPCSICFNDIEDGYSLEECNHEFCRSCLIEQCESAIKNHRGRFPICCAHEGCEALILVVDFKSLLSTQQIDDLFRASLNAFVDLRVDNYRFCPSADCDSVYQVQIAEEKGLERPFVCGTCSAETCTRCSKQYHPALSCEKYLEYTNDPDLPLKEWVNNNKKVKHCPACNCVIEKDGGCDHVQCVCGSHICWMCLAKFKTNEECYAHIRYECYLQG